MKESCVTIVYILCKLLHHTVTITMIDEKYMDYLLTQMGG